MNLNLKNYSIMMVFILNFHTQSWCADLDPIDKNNPSLNSIQINKTDTSKLQMKARDLISNVNDCKECHLLKTKRFHKKEYNPERAHQNIKNFHGNRVMSCHSCHDINNRNLLLSTKYYPADFSNSSPVCAQCHNEVFRDWKKGLHGKRIGGWQTPKEQFHCIDCHSPHSVKFPQTEAIFPPHQSPAIIPHHSTER